MSDINLIGTDSWTDLISQQTVSAEQVELRLDPYQTLWLTNQYSLK